MAWTTHAIGTQKRENVARERKRGKESWTFLPANELEVEFCYFHNINSLGG